MKKITLLAISLTTMLGVSTSLNAQGLIDGFVDEEGALSVSTTYSKSTFTEAYVGKNKKKLIEIPLPYKRLNQDVYNLFAKYMINAKLSALINIPYIIGTGDATADVPDDGNKVSGIQDVTMGLRYNMYTFEYENSDLVVLSGITISIPSDYEPNGVVSMGTGALTTDFTLGLQYQTDYGFFTTLTAAYSLKDDLDTNGVYTGIPNSFLAGAKVGYSTRTLFISGWFDMSKAMSGVDIGGKGFVGNLPETRVDYIRAGASITKSLTEDLKLSIGYGKVLDGRNVGSSDIYSAGIIYNIQLL